QDLRWESTALGILKARCIAYLFSWSKLYPAVNAEQLQDFIDSLVLAKIVYLVSQRIIIIKGSREILLQHRAQQEMGHSERKTQRGYAGTGWQRSLHN
ncbi:hypothetical protein H5410_000526, partial [Solanum commersonii]